MQIRISDDGLEAYVISASRGDFAADHDVTPSDLTAALHQKSILEGIETDSLQFLVQALAQGGSYSGQPVLVARGKPPGDGQDGKVELCPPKEAASKKEKLTWLTFPGEKVATIVPPSPGEPGLNVRGEKVPGKPGNEAKVAVGVGVELGRNGSDIVANVAGFLKVDSKGISVESPVTVSKDKMTAYLNVLAPKKVAVPLGVEDYHKLLRSSGVVHGIKKEAIEKAVRESRETGEDRNGVIVAKATEPKRGEDAKVEFKFSLNIRPGLLLPGGKIDYRERDLVHNVTAGQELAVKIPPAPGTPGTTVVGEPIPAQPGKDVHLKALENVQLTEDKMKLVAKREGMAMLDRGGGVRVITEFAIRGDVDYSTGNVRCKGTVRVEGSVLPGFNLESGQDVIIDGGIDSANVHAGGNLFVAHGIQGSPDTEIVAAAEIRALFIESATVRAKGDIVLGQSVRHSDVRTAGVVKVTERKGTIVGGRILATRGIIANEVGSELGTRTELIAGVDMMKLARLEALEKDMDTCESNLRRFDVQLGPAVEESKKIELPSGQKQWLAKLLAERSKVVAERDRAVEERTRLASEIRSDLSARVRIMGEVHPGVVVRIGEATYTVGDPTKNVTFTYNTETREIVCTEE
jgi:hypothetical protein